MASMNTKMDEFVAKQKMLEDAMAKHGEAMKQMMALIEQMAKAPMSEPASPVANQYTSQKPMDKDERFESILEAINKIKNN
jgi:mRNA-degrading endonuclease HigB of HigAB toxin-antitoxin module